jgi:dTDP-glucose 4,6-dehydratase
MTSPASAPRKLGCLLVTGGAGFIGSAFIRYLFRQPSFTGKIVNYDLLTYAGNLDNVAGAVDEGRYRFVHGDICDRDRLLKTCDDEGVDTIVGATGLFTEDSPYQPNSPYSASKAGSDHLVRAYAHTYGISTTHSNCSNNYGPFQFPEKLVPLMVLNMLEGKPLPVYGDGMNVRDWLYVDDHAEAIWLVLRSGKTGESYNVGGRAEWANLPLLNRLIEIVAEQAGREVAALKNLITFVKDRPGHDRRYAVDSSKIETELGFRQAHNLDTGLAETVRWYIDNRAWVERVRSGAYREWIEKNYATR